MSTQEGVVYQYFNPIQYKSYLVYANQEILIAGRGTGKSSGVIAPRLIRWATDMPRATIMAVAATYQQHYTRTLPEVFAGMAKLGWIEGRDYWIGKYAPDKLKVDKPIVKPLKTQYIIHFRTGACVILVSLDMPGSANGLSAQALFGDEAKFLKYDKFKDEVLPAVRGNSHIFGDAPCFGGMLLTSDMPVSSSGQWLLELGDKSHDEDRIAEIMFMQNEQNKIKLKLISPEYTDITKAQYRKKYNAIEEALKVMRRGDPESDIKASFLFHEASSLENIQVLRPAYFEKMRNDLSPFEYNRSILNLRQTQITDGFYPGLSEDYHGYTNFNNGYLETFGHDFNKFREADSRQDGDVNPNEPLDIAFDYGGRFNCCVVGQVGDNCYQFLHGFHVHHPKKLTDLVLEFKQYFRHHKRKHVRFPYDHTAIGKNALVDFTYYDEIIRVLQSSEYGEWTVDPVNIGHTSDYQTRYELWNKVLSPSNKIIPFRYNINHCEFWSISCMLAPIKQSSKGFEKDKASERSKSHPQERATHYSDAGDTLAIFAIKPLLEISSSQGFSGWNA